KGRAPQIAGGKNGGGPMMQQQKPGTAGHTGGPQYNEPSPISAGRELHGQIAGASVQSQVGMGAGSQGAMGGSNITNIARSNGSSNATTIPGRGGAPGQPAP